MTPVTLLRRYAIVLNCDLNDGMKTMILYKITSLFLRRVSALWSLKYLGFTRDSPCAREQICILSGSGESRAGSKRSNSVPRRLA